MAKNYEGITGNRNNNASFLSYNKNGNITIDKNSIFKQYMRLFFTKTNKLFKYENLPDTLNRRIIELYLQQNGFTAFAKHNGELYTYFGGLGGVPDEYYMPTIFTVANPAQKFSKNLEIDKECVIVPNDSTYTGLVPIFERYAYLLTENYISMRVFNINSRIPNILTASTENQKAAANEYMKNIEKGNLSALVDNLTTFGGGIDTKPFSGAVGHNSMTDLIEFEQYLKASLWNELGLQSNYNMKREAINSNESQLNYDSTRPLIDDMLLSRKEGIEKVNELFGTNITVDLDGVWLENMEKNELEIDAMEEEVNGNEEKEADNDENAESDIQ